MFELDAHCVRLPSPDISDQRCGAKAARSVPQPADKLVENVGAGWPIIGSRVGAEHLNGAVGGDGRGEGKELAVALKHLLDERQRCVHQPVQIILRFLRGRFTP